MATSLKNISFDGSPVQLRLDSPVLVCFDPLALGGVAPFPEIMQLC